MSSENLQGLQLQFLEHLCLGCMTYRKNLDEPCSCGWRDDSQNDRHQLCSGSSLAGRYMVGRVLGEGGFGITYLGWSIKQNKKVAIKEFFPGKKYVRRDDDRYTVTPIGGSEFNQKFQGECRKFFDEYQRVAAFDADPNIVRAEDCFNENGTAYIVMEFVEGKTLAQYININGRMTFNDAVNVLAPLADSLERMHAQNLIHRDISPENIMLTDNKTVKLLDFGIAREFSSSIKIAKGLTESYKEGYSPLEQYFRFGDQGSWTDEYALAATIYFAITDSVPTEAMERSNGAELIKPTQLGAVITSEQEKSLLKGMSIKYEDRYPTVREFYNALTGKNQSAKPSGDYPNGVDPRGVFAVLLEKIRTLPQWFAPAVIVALGALVILSSESKGEDNPSSTLKTSMNVSSQSEQAQSAPSTNSERPQSTPPPAPTSEHPAVKTLKDFHESITQRNLSQAFNCLDSDMQHHMGGFDSWASGFATTVSSTPLDIKIIDEMSDRVVLNYMLEAVDNPGGKNYFDGTAVLIKTGFGWRIADIKNKVR